MKSYYGTRVKWSEAEDNILREHFPHKSNTEIIPLLNQRTDRSIDHRAARLGLLRTGYARSLIAAQASSKSQVTTNYDFNSLTKEELQYLCGAVDCDGSIRLFKNTWGYTPSIGLTNTSTKIIDWLKEKFPDATFQKNIVRTGDLIRGKEVKNRKQSYNFKITGIDSVCQLLKKLEPYLLLKQNQAQAILSIYDKGWFNVTLTEQEKICNEIKIMKKSYSKLLLSHYKIIPELSYAYLAGCIDHDGCCRIHQEKKLFTPRLDITNEGIVIHEWLNHHGLNFTKSKNRSIYHIMTGALGLTAKVLLNVEPYLIIKRKQAQLALKLLENRDNPELCFSIKEQISNLNKQNYISRSIYSEYFSA